MAIIKKAIKSVSTVIGEILVIGGALGTTYVLGFLKGSKISDHVEEAADFIKKEVNAKVNNNPVAETAVETESEESPSIEVTTNQQED